MKKQNDTNVNTPEYFDEFFSHTYVTKDMVLRQEIMLSKVGANPHKIIELACGLSYFCQMAKQAYPKSEVWGLDFSLTAIEKMRKSFGKKQYVNYVLGDALKTPFKSQYFDYVFCGETLEHLERPIELIEEMARITAWGGKFVLSTPNTLIEDETHLWLFTPEEVIEMMTPFGDCDYEIIKSDVFPGREYIIATCTRLG
jgi:ubiquinone/menaquinone biosynthesis C-methylase UbiE